MRSVYVFNVKQDDTISTYPLYKELDNLFQFNCDMFSVSAPLIKKSAYGNITKNFDYIENIKWEPETFSINFFRKKLKKEIITIGETKGTIKFENFFKRQRFIGIIELFASETISDKFLKAAEIISCFGYTIFCGYAANVRDQIAPEATLLSGIVYDGTVDIPDSGMSKTEEKIAISTTLNHKNHHSACLPWFYPLMLLRLNNEDKINLKSMLGENGVVDAADGLTLIKSDNNFFPELGGEVSDYLIDKGYINIMSINKN